MEQRIRRIAYIVGGVLLAAMLVAIVASLFRKPTVTSTPGEVGFGGVLEQRDRETGELLWRVRLGRIERVAGAEEFRVTDVECEVYSGGVVEFVVRAPILSADTEKEALEFAKGIELASERKRLPAYAAKAGRLLYSIEKSEAVLEEKVEFRYGRMKIFGPGAIASFTRKGLSRIAMDYPRKAGKYLCAAVIALAGVMPVHAAQTLDTRNATLHFEHFLADFAESKISIWGAPEIVMEGTTLTAERFDVLLSEDQGEVVGASAGGGVTITSINEDETRKVVATGPEAVYTASNNQATLSGGTKTEIIVAGRTSTLTSPSIVADLTAKTVSATGGAELEADIRGGSASFQAASVSYQFEAYGREPEGRIVATGSPRFSSSTATAETTTEIRGHSGAMTALYDAERGLVSAELTSDVSVNIRQTSRGAGAGGPREFEVSGGKAEYDAAEGGRLVVSQSPRVHLKTGFPGVLKAQTLTFNIEAQSGDATGGVEFVSDPAKDREKGERVRIQADAARLTSSGEIEFRDNVQIASATPGEEPSDFATAGALTYSGDRAVLSGSPRVYFQFKPKAGRPSEGVLTADEFVYDSASGKIEAVGHPQYRSGETLITAGHVTAQVDTDTGEVLSAVATGGIEYKDVIVYKEDTPSETHWLAMGRADTARLIPNQPPPATYESRGTVDAAVMQGNVNVTVKDKATERLVQTFTNVETVTVYLYPKQPLITTEAPTGERSAINLTLPRQEKEKEQ